MLEKLVSWNQRRIQYKTQVDGNGPISYGKKNEETHKADGNRGSAREKLKAESRTRALHEQASQLIVEDREMFAMPLDERLQRPAKALLS
jgi:hypothetical protein